MKKTKRKVGKSAKVNISAERYWLGNPLFAAALITIMAVLAFILVDDWVNLRKSRTVPSVMQRITVTPRMTPTPAVRAK